MDPALGVPELTRHEEATQRLEHGNAYADSMHEIIQTAVTALESGPPDMRADMIRKAKKLTST